MRDDVSGPADPGEWLRRARSNLARARAGRVSPDVLFEDVCFDAQQAAEKAVKAVLVHRRIPFARTHSIADLLFQAVSAGVSVPEEVRQAVILTAYAVERRYPSSGEPVSEEEWTIAVRLAGAVVEWARSLVESGPPSG